MGKCAEKCSSLGRVICDLSWQILLIVIQMCGIACSLVAIVDCKFYSVTYSYSGGPPSNVPNVTGLGLFQYQVTSPGEDDTCVSYVGSKYEDWLDLPIQLGGIFGAISTVVSFVGWVVTLFTLFLLCCLNMKGTKWIIGTFFIVCMILQGLTFLFVATDVCWKYNTNAGVTPQCNISRSAGFSIAAIVLFFWAGVQACAMSWPEDAIGKDTCWRACCKDEDVEAQEEKAAEEEEEKVEEEEENPEAAPEDPNAAAAAAAGAAGGAAVVTAVAEDDEEEKEEEKEEETEEGDKQDEEAGEAAKEDDDMESAKSDFSEDDDDDGSSFDEDDEEEGDMKNEEKGSTTKGKGDEVEVEA